MKALSVKEWIIENRRQTQVLKSKRYTHAMRQAMKQTRKRKAFITQMYNMGLWPIANRKHWTDGGVMIVRFEI